MDKKPLWRDVCPIESTTKINRGNSMLELVTFGKCRLFPNGAYALYGDSYPWASHFKNLMDKTSWIFWNKHNVCWLVKRGDKEQIFLDKLKELAPVNQAPLPNPLPDPKPLPNGMEDWLANPIPKFGFIKAVAGSGKTTALKSALYHIKTQTPDARILFLCFNKSIQIEVNKVYGAHADIHTLHAFGKRHFLPGAKSWKPKANIGESPQLQRIASWTKKKSVAYDIVDTEYPNLPNKEKWLVIDNLVRFMTQFQIQVPAIETFDADSFYQFYHQIGLAQECEDQVIGLFGKMFELLTSATKFIDFEDMIWLPLVNNIPPLSSSRYDWILLDENQDLNKAQIRLVEHFLLHRPNCKMLAVGDPKQAIYLFRGAQGELSPLFTPNVTFELNECRRCPVSHIDLARCLVPQITGCNQDPGVISWSTYDEAFDKVDIGNLVLSRNNKPIVQFAYQMIKRKKKAYIEGDQELKDQLIEMIDFLLIEGPLSIEGFQNKLTEQKELDIGKLKKTHRRGEVVKKTDFFDCLLYLSSQETSIDALKSSIETLFPPTDEGEKFDPTSYIRCSSVHRAKGAESDCVWILEPNLFFANKSNDRGNEEELNVLYVAITRSKHTMIFVGEKFLDLNVIQRFNHILSNIHVLSSKLSL